MADYYNKNNGHIESWTEQGKPDYCITEEEYLELHPYKYFAVVGTNETEKVRWIDDEYTPTKYPNAIEMVSDITYPYYTAQSDGTWYASLDDAKEYKTNEIQTKSNNLMNEVKKGYTDGEISTFEQQYKGATDILNGDATTTDAIFVLGLLNGRLGKEPTSEELNDFCELIVNNYMTAASATGKILGKQQNLEIKVRNANTVEEVENIIWNDNEALV